MKRTGMVLNIHGWAAHCGCGRTSTPRADKRDAMQVAADAGFIVCRGNVTCHACKEIQVQAERSRPRRRRR